jgi:hypothetical protein
LVTLIAPATVAAAPPATPAAAAIKVLSSSSYTDSIGYLHIVGEVKNTTTSKRRFVQVSARLYNANDRVLGSTFSYTLMDILRPGVVTPSHIIKERPSGYHHYRLSTSSSTTSETPIRRLDIQRGVAYVDSIDYKHVPGEVKNNNGFKVRFVQVIATVYNDAGRVINVGFTYTDPHEIPSGAKRGFELLLGERYDGRIKLQVDAQR